MGALAHAFEATGIATVTLGSIRAQLEGTAVPRGLFCDFPLGRPLGRPNDPEYQHRVLWQALSMVDRVSDPTIEDFPHAIVDDGESAVTCPMATATRPQRSSRVDTTEPTPYERQVSSALCR